MIAEWFVLENGLISINKPVLHLIPEFEEIVKKDKGKYSNGKKVEGDHDGRKKLLARRKLTYIYFLCDYKTDFFDRPEVERHRKALELSQLDESEIDGLVDSAIIKYKSFIDNLSIRSYQAAVNVQNELNDYLNDIDFNQCDEGGRLKNNPKQILDIIKSLGTTIADLKELKAKAYKDTDDLVKKRIRADAKIGEYEHAGSFRSYLNKEEEEED